MLAAANKQLWEAGAQFFALVTDVQDAAAKAAAAAESAASGSGDVTAAAAAQGAAGTGKPPVASPAKGGKRPDSAAPPPKGKGAAAARAAAAADSDDDGSSDDDAPPARAAAARPAGKIGGGFAQLAGGSDSEGESDEAEEEDDDASSSGREEEQQQGRPGVAAQKGKGPRGPAEPARAAAAGGKGGAASFACKMCASSPSLALFFPSILPHFLSTRGRCFVHRMKSSSVSYPPSRCRSLLWCRDDVLQHGWGADRREFASGGGGGKGAAAASDDNRCLTNVFVSLSGGADLEGAPACACDSPLPRSRFRCPEMLNLSVLGPAYPRRPPPSAWNRPRRGLWLRRRVGGQGGVRQVLREAGALLRGGAAVRVRGAG